MQQHNQVRELPRGGTVVCTSAGSIQFGAPPETIKDSLDLGLAVPEHWVPVGEWFDRVRGQSFAELEFPAYFNRFRLGRPIHVLVTQEGRARVERILRESFFGPETVSPRDFADTVPHALRPNLRAEMDYFARHADGRPITMSDLVRFSLLDESNAVTLGDVVIRLNEHSFVVESHGAVIAEISRQQRRRARISQEITAVALPAFTAFEPPPFGLTVLGSSHGFDPGGKTTGFVLWIQRRGILVDPPIGSQAILRSAGISPKAIDTVVLTHCHADHDSGLLQKILEEGRVTVYTTPTILGSFLRKCEALTAQSEELLRRLFRFRPVVLGQETRIFGAEFRFFYTLHSIPTIGFEVFWSGKSFAYSSDTLYDPPRIESMVKEGVLSPERRDALLAFPWHDSLILHEAGVPPIHTPVARLAELPEDVKPRVRLIHLAAGEVPPNAGLQLARAGLEHTITIGTEEPPYAEALDMLDALSRIDLFAEFNVERCREFLTVARPVYAPAGTQIIGEGQVGDRFYIVMEGEVEVVRHGTVVKIHGAGDFFGETSLVTGALRSADVRARTAVRLLAIDKADFLSLVRNTDLVPALLRLAHNRELESWDVIAENMQLDSLTSGQKTDFQAMLEPVVLHAGSALWPHSGEIDAGYLIDKALVALVDQRGVAPRALGRGAFVVDLDAMFDEAKPATVEVVTSGSAYRIGREPLRLFLERAPALRLALFGVPFVE